MNWQAYISNQTDISSILEFDEQPNTYSLIDGAYIYIYIYVYTYIMTIAHVMYPQIQSV